LVFLTAAVLIFLVFSNWKIDKKRAELNNQIDSLQKQIQTLEQKNTQLKEETNQNQSLDYQEKIARENLDYKKPGEDVVVVKPAASTTQESNSEQKSFWQKILEKIGL
jgi:cell division protein FtsL